MAMGMSYDEFWDAPPRRAIAYREAYKLKRMADNELAWLNGIYTFDAFAVCLANAFAKSGAKKQTYIEKPLDIYPISAAEKKRREQEEFKKMDAALQAIRNKQQRDKLKRGD